MVYGVNDMASAVPAYIVPRRDPRTQSEGVVEGYAQTALRWPVQPLVRRSPGVSELSAPRPSARLKATGADLAGRGVTRALGQLIDVRVSVVDEDRAPLTGAMVETWHCNAAGKYIHPNDSNDAPADLNFYGAARLLTDRDGRISLRTIKPGAYPVPDSGGWWRPPHIHFSVWGRVWLSRLVTQMFFPGDPLNELDHILNAVRDPEARGRCIARFVPRASDTRVYEYELVVRGRKASAALP